jgi:hypothetical protein
MQEFTETNRVNFEKDLVNVLHKPQLDRRQEMQENPLQDVLNDD